MTTSLGWVMLVHLHTPDYASLYTMSSRTQPATLEDLYHLLTDYWDRMYICDTRMTCFHFKTVNPQIILEKKVQVISWRVWICPLLIISKEKHKPSNIKTWCTQSTHKKLAVLANDGCHWIILKYWPVLADWAVRLALFRCNKEARRLITARLLKHSQSLAILCTT